MKVGVFMPKGRKIETKLYLEGIKIPFQSINIIEQVGTSAYANVTLPASASSLYLIPKTIAHVFYKIEDEYYLIFEGSLSGHRYAKSEGKKSVILNFTSFSEELNRVYVATMDVASIPNEPQKEAHFLALNSDTTWSGSIYNNPFPWARGTRNSEENTENDEKNKNQKVDSEENTENDEKNKKQKMDWVINDQIAITGFLTNLRTNLRKAKSLSAMLLTQENSLLNYVKEKNPYYRMLVEGLKLYDRMYITDNPKTSDMIANEQLQSLVAGHIQRIGTNTPVINALMALFEYIKYDWVDFSAPTWDSKKEKMYQMIIKPKTQYFLPVLPNVIFSDQVGQLDYNRNMNMEPTRMMFRSHPFMIQSEEGANAAPQLFYYTSPHMVMEKDEKTGAPIFRWTYEERLRGVQPVRSESPLPRTHPKDIASSGFPAEAWFESEETQEITDLTQIHADRKFFDEKYKYRGLNVIVDYSPYRMIGFPALVLDEEMPAIYGTIKAINSTISSNGNATQSLIIDSPKHVEIEDSKFLKENSELIEQTKLFESIPEFPSYYDTNLFSPFLIGRGFYKDLVRGDSERFQGTSYKSEGKIVSPSPLDFFLTSLDSKVDSEENTENSKGEDCSIYKFVNTHYKSITKNTVGAIRVSSSFILDYIKQAHRYSRREMVNHINDRRLVKEEEFWNFLGFEKPIFRGLEDEGYTNVGYQNVKNISHDTFDATNKPFIDVRAYMVNKLKMTNNVEVHVNEGFNYNV